MTTAFSMLMALVLVAMPLRVQAKTIATTQAASEIIESARFTSIDVQIDSAGTPLAAYQIEIRATKGDVTIVGIEGSEHPAFKDPPFYDPTAMRGNRVILAAFNTSSAKDLPTGRTRIARVHVRIVGSVAPVYSVKLTVAAAPDAKPIAGAAASISEGAGT